MYLRKDLCLSVVRLSVIRTRWPPRTASQLLIKEDIRYTVLKTVMSEDWKLAYSPSHAIYIAVVLHRLPEIEK